METKLNDAAIRAVLGNKTWSVERCIPLVALKEALFWIIGGLAFSPIWLWLLGGLIR